MYDTVVYTVYAALKLYIEANIQHHQRIFDSRKKHWEKKKQFNSFNKDKYVLNVYKLVTRVSKEKFKSLYFKWKR